ncbi:MAG: DUF4270 domain-containing protein [Bacteroidetes bacterium]|nr:DUF4270 domain-containing protein [Bacteroidota bacterium]
MKILNGAWNISMLVVLSFGIYLTSCTKKAQLIGLEVRPTANLEVESTDTATLVAFSEVHDSLITYNYSRILLGSMMDPVFGQTTANYYTQLRLKSGIDSFNFGPNPVVDSLILSLAYSGYYGDTNTYQTLKVYELNEKLVTDSTHYYYSFDKLLYKPIEIGRITFQPQPNTPIYQYGTSDTTTYNPHISIDLLELGNAFGTKLISTPVDILQNNERFIDYINGLCIISEPVNTGGSIIYIDLSSSFTKLTAYYSNDSATGKIYSMNFYDSTYHFNNFDHNNYQDASPEFKAQVLDGNTSLGEELIYVQALGGVRTKITFPFIKNLKSIGNIAINSAELTIKGIEDNNGNKPPDRLTLDQINHDGTTTQGIIDMVEGDAYFGGFYDSVKNEYKFQIARYIHKLINTDANDNGIYLKVYGNATGGGQFIINGTNPALPTPYSDRLKLMITYTIIE